MANLFNTVLVNKLKRNVFDLSHEVKLSMDMGQLVPIMCEEVVPGDSFRLNTEILMRFAPMLAPIMHRVNVYTHFFFVPYRLVWNEFKTFITGGEDGKQLPVFPTLSPTASFLNQSGNGKEGSLMDYMGLPVLKPNETATQGMQFSALPFRAYQMIYNEYYRDQNLQEPISFSVGSGAATELGPLLTLRNRCWEKDYFTSSLPWAQRGGDVHLPMAGEAPVYFDPSVDKPQQVRYTTPVSGDNNLSGFSPDGQNPGILTKSGTSGANGAWLDPNGTLKADMSGVTSATINELRRSVQLQKWLERNARSGARYIEQILSHFGVKSSDGRLQRPEYLGGGKSPVIVSEVLQTSSTDTESPQANMAGHAISVGNTHQFKRFFEEHGFVIGILSVLSRTAYQQGIPRKFFKYDKFDYFWPEFAHLGEQEVKLKELYYDPAGTDAPSDSTFGYQSRYSEYKYCPSRVAGDFRSSLAYWHLGRIFDGPPALNGKFVTADSINRIFAVESSDVNHLYVQVYHNLRAIRPMPKFGVPSF